MSYVVLDDTCACGPQTLPATLFSSSFKGRLYRLGNTGVLFSDRVIAACMRIWKSSIKRDQEWNRLVRCGERFNGDIGNLVNHPSFLPGYNDAVWKRVNQADIGFRKRGDYTLVSPDQIQKDGRIPKFIRVALKAGAIGVIGLLSAPLLIPAAAFGVPLRMALAPAMNELTLIPAKGETKEYDGDFLVVTQNVAQTEFDIMDSLNEVRPTRQRAEELLHQLIRNFSRHDIICLQEAFTPAINRKVGEALGAQGFSTLFQGRPLRFGMSSGLLLASRYEIVAADFIRFHHSSGVDADAGKGVMMAKVKLSEKLFAFIAVTHMQASAAAPQNEPQQYPDQALNKIHREQLERIDSFMSHFTTANTHGDDEILFTLLCGDLNISRLGNLFGNPVIYANSLVYKPLEDFLGGKFHELTETGDSLEDQEEAERGTGLGVNSASYRFAKEQVIRELQNLVPLPYRSHKKLKRFIDTGFDFTLYRQKEWNEAIIKLQREGIPLPVVRELIQAIKARIPTWGNRIYREAGVIDHLLLRSGQPEQFFSRFSVERTTGTILGKGGPVSDHAYVQARITEKEEPASLKGEAGSFEVVSLTS